MDLSRIRGDIASELRRQLMEESPSAYKNVQAVLDTVTESGMASRVATLSPLLTVKG